MDSGSGAKSTITAQVGRACELSCNPAILEACAKAVAGLTSTFGEKDGTFWTGDETKPLEKEESVKAGVSQSVVALEHTELRFSTVRVSMEISVPSDVCTASTPGPGLVSGDPPPLTEQQLPPSQGLLLSWDKLSVSLASSREKAATTSCSGLQLSSQWGAGRREYVVLPTTLECRVAQHSPCSPLDR